MTSIFCTMTCFLSIVFPKIKSALSITGGFSSVNMCYLVPCNLSKLIRSFEFSDLLGETEQQEMVRRNQLGLHNRLLTVVLDRVVLRHHHLLSDLHWLGLNSLGIVLHTIIDLYQIHLTYEELTGFWGFGESL